MQIEQANLPCTVYRTARRLLDRADYNGGRVTLSEEEFMAICQTDAIGTMRSHLIKLASAGIIRYKRRGVISIEFEAWPQQILPGHRAPCEDKAMALRPPEVIAQRSLSVTDAEKRALSDHFEGEEVIAERSDSATDGQKRALSDQKVIAQRSKVASTSHAGVVCLSVTNDPLLPGDSKNKQTNTAPKTKKLAVVTDPAEIALSVDLLTDDDVGMSKRRAAQTATEYHHAYLETQVYIWRRELEEGKVKSVGALINRLRDDFGGTLTPADRATDLYRRHHPEHNPDHAYTDFGNTDPHPDDDPLAWRAAFNRARLAIVATGPGGAAPP